MKIYILHVEILYGIGKSFEELNDNDVIHLCDEDKMQDNHDVYGSLEELKAAWNTECAIFSPAVSYMYIIND